MEPYQFPTLLLDHLSIEWNFPAFVLIGLTNKENSTKFKEKYKEIEGKLKRHFFAHEHKFWYNHPLVCYRIYFNTNFQYGWGWESWDVQVNMFKYMMNGIIEWFTDELNEYENTQNYTIEDIIYDYMVSDLDLDESKYKHLPDVNEMYKIMCILSQYMKYYEEDESMYYEHMGDPGIPLIEYAACAFALFCR